MKKEKLAFILMIGCLAGCAGSYRFSTPIPPSELTRAEGKKIVLEDSQEMQIEFSNGVQVFKIPAGGFVPELKNNTGIFYRSENPIVEDFAFSDNIFQKDKKSRRSYTGGVFLPNARNEPVKVYYYIGSGASSSAQELAVSLGSQGNANSSKNAIPGSIGTGLGVALVDSIIAADRGKIFFPPKQPDSQALRKAFDN